MNTRTRSPQRPATGGRFPRQLAGTRRGTTPTRRPIPRPSMRLGKRPPQKSTAGKALEGLTGLLPTSGGKARSRGGGGKGKAGVALLAGVAGLAFKNRDKLTSRLGRKSADQQVEPSITGAEGEESIAPTVAGGVTRAADGGQASEASVPPTA